MYPARATLQHVIKARWEVVWQKAGKTLPVFFFVNEHNNTNTKPQAKKQRFLKLSQKFPEEKQQLVEEKDADNIRKVLCKSFIQWFWELNLCCYKYRVDCFGSFSFAPVILLLLLKWKSRNITKHLMSDPSGNQLVLFSLESWCFPRLCLGKHQDSRVNKTVSHGIWH